jgi:SAM-dependent methyltransferase
LNRSGTEAAFDAHAPGYDTEFSETLTGRLQRNLVWHYIKNNLPLQNHPRVLEINCGTGVDALWLHSNGFTVTATDLSPGMLATAAAKTNAVQFIRCSFLELEKHFEKESFDVLFSNFGGLNCTDAAGLEKLAATAANLLRPGGRFIAVVMGDNCRWETIYFNRKGEPEKANRRSSGKPVEAVIDGNRFPVWYYSTQSFAACFEKSFTVKATRAIGWMLPPSYLDNAFRNKSFLLRVFYVLDRWFGKRAFAINRADHFLADLVKKNR